MENTILQALKEMEERINGRFEKMDERFVGVDQRFDTMDERFVSVDQRFDQIEERLIRMEETQNSDVVALLKTIKNNQEKGEIETGYLAERVEELSKKVYKIERKIEN